MNEITLFENEIFLVLQLFIVVVYLHLIKFVGQLYWQKLMESFEVEEIIASVAINFSRLNASFFPSNHLPNFYFFIYG